jgi:hypothetical protein
MTKLGSRPEMGMSWRRGRAAVWALAVSVMVSPASAGEAAPTGDAPAAAPAPAADASSPAELPFWQDKNCIRETKRAWCDATITKLGWVFKSKSESPMQMKDPVFYIEFYEKDGQRLKCEIQESKGVIVKNECKLMGAPQ